MGGAATRRSLSRLFTGGPPAVPVGPPTGDLLVRQAPDHRPRPDRTRCVQLWRVCLLCRFLKAAESRDKVFTLPELTILAFHKLLRFMDGLFLVRTFDASYC